MALPYSNRISSTYRPVLSSFQLWLVDAQNHVVNHKYGPFIFVIKFVRIAISLKCTYEQLFASWLIDNRNSKSLNINLPLIFSVCDLNYGGLFVQHDPTHGICVLILQILVCYKCLSFGYTAAFAGEPHLVPEAARDSRGRSGTVYNILSIFLHE